jgi:hypothetical protein
MRSAYSALRVVACTALLAAGADAFAADPRPAVTPQPYFQYADFGSLKISPSG